MPFINRPIDYNTMYINYIINIYDIYSMKILKYIYYCLIIKAGGIYGLVTDAGLLFVTAADEDAERGMIVL